MAENVCESNITIPLVQGILNPCVGDLGGFVTLVLTPTTGQYYDIGTGMIRDYTNPDGLDIQIASRICLDPFSTEAVQSVDNSGISTIQFFIDGTAITAITPINSDMTSDILQIFIDFGITDSNATITVNSFDPTGLDITVTLSTTIAKTELEVVVNPPISGTDTYTSTFTCDVPPIVPTKRKPKKRAAIQQFIDVAFLPEESVPPVVNYNGFTFVSPNLIFQGTLGQLGNHTYIISSGIQQAMQNNNPQVNKAATEWIVTMPTKVYRYTNSVYASKYYNQKTNVRE